MSVALPVLTVTAKVVLLPFVKVIVLRLTLAVTKNEPLSVSVTKLPVWPPNVVHLVSLLPVYVASVVFFVF